MSELPTEPYNKEHVRKLSITNVNKALEYLNRYFYKIINPVGILYWDYSMGRLVFYRSVDVLNEFIPHVSKQKTRIVKCDGDDDKKKAVHTKIHLPQYWSDHAPLYTKP